MLVAAPPAASEQKGVAMMAIPFTRAGLRLFEIVGNCYEPDLSSHSFLMVVPADRHLYDGEYLLDFGNGEAPYRATSHGGRIHFCHPNPVYDWHDLPRADFDKAVTAIVVAEVKVKDERAIRQACAAQVAA